MQQEWMEPEFATPEVPLDVIAHISGFTDAKGKARMRLVCKNWRERIPCPKPPPPRVLLMRRLLKTLPTSFLRRETHLCLQVFLADKKGEPGGWPVPIVPLSVVPYNVEPLGDAISWMVDPTTGTFLEWIDLRDKSRFEVIDAIIGFMSLANVYGLVTGWWHFDVQGLRLLAKALNIKGRHTKKELMQALIANNVFPYDWEYYTMYLYEVWIED